MAKKNDTFGKTLGVVIGLCLVCSLVVSGAAVALKPLQERNKAEDTQRYVLEAAGLLDKIDGGIQATFNRYIDARVIDFTTGEFDASIDATTYDQRKAARDTATSSVPANDVASIKRRADKGLVYLVKDASGELETVILPIHGYGLWSTMYAFVALEPDFNTVKAMVYYDQGETPGLGAEVENPRWKAQWVGKELFDADGKLAIKVVKGGAREGDIHGVDGLSGATLTSNGVQNSLDFWMGDEGYAAFLAKARKGELNNG
ncbi:Na(+)-translocating NADH-quinone reductase subunit C [Ferrimonas balearica]|uniref:Na(+)-translocating NADH-quinone reductase subunit C n=1 Tax=Ferrimonas balearica TaxID=44012 RepID=UPI001F342041|nr:Na(+)-translocating NADH-quinone reductase subunit C [Ferrimonas balearica]MBY6018104.1 Na(+)-translocating NADH-quinone reductase subunit C [Halomonas denitrificans]MBY6094443.1 Na(+)-translocating NADH-quinone reductase subunit C [Ferrimonas balearica]